MLFNSKIGYFVKSRWNLLNPFRSNERDWGGFFRNLYRLVVGAMGRCSFGFP